MLPFTETMFILTLAQIKKAIAQATMHQRVQRATGVKPIRSQLAGRLLPAGSGTIAARHIDARRYVEEAMRLELEADALTWHHRSVFAPHHL